MTRKKYDALVVGSGIGGMESALKLGDMGYKVLVVEKEPSVGGKMILLSKVFPTLDCASCISTPKMGATIHHPNIDVLTYAEVEAIRGNGGDGNGHGPALPRQDQAEGQVRRRGRLHRLPPVRDGLQRRRARRVQRRHGVAAGGVHRLPAGGAEEGRHHPRGRVAVQLRVPGGHQGARLRRARAQRRVRPGVRPGPGDDAARRLPRARVLRALRGRVHARRARGPAADPPPQALHRRRAVRPGRSRKAVEKPEQNGKKVAVVGSGPAGLTAAWQLARKGYGVKIYEQAERAGGFLALGIPAYRLPNDVVDDDIGNVTAIGVEIETGVTVEDPAKLKDDGFDAVLVATGTHKAVQLRVPGEDKDGVMSALTFLADVKLGKNVDLGGRKVLVVGGGNVAIDAARTARRLGAAEVHQASLECCDDMPAHDFEVEEAKAEGITLHDGWGVNHFTGDGKVESAVLKVCTCVFDPDGQVRPRVRREQEADRRVRRRHRRRRHGRRHRGVRPRDQPQPDAQGRRRHAADGGAAHLRRRRRRHRPER